MPRELLKFRPGDVGLKIQKNGQLTLAGVTPDIPMIDREGNVNPALLFAAAWVKKDPKLFELLIQNFKDSVGDGVFGEAAQTDYKDALQMKQQMEDDKVRDPKSDTSAAASGAVTFEQPEMVEVGTPKPLTAEEHLSRRNS